MANISKEAKFLLDWLQEKYAEIIQEEQYKDLPDNCKKLHIYSKSEFITLEPILFQETNRIFSMINIGGVFHSINEGINIREYQGMTQNVRDWIKNETKSLMFSLNRFKETNGLINYDPYGVVVLKESIDRMCRADSISSLKLKLPAWEIIIRHELGHVIADCELYNDIEPDEFKRMNDNINKFAKIQKNRWDLEDSTDPFHYHMNFYEHMANHMSNISMATVVLATKIIGTFPDEEIKKYNKNEGSKTRKRKEREQNPPKKNNKHSKFRIN